MCLGLNFETKSQIMLSHGVNMTNEAQKFHYKLSGFGIKLLEIDAVP